MKFLAIKLAALRSEIKISREILLSASGEVDRMFLQKYFPEVPTNNSKSDETGIDERAEDQEPEEDKSQEKETQDNAPTEETSAPPKTVDPEVKKLFRKISLSIHPDKLVGLEDGYEKEKKIDLFTKARAALEDNDLLTLADVALEIGLEVPEMDEAKLKSAEKQIKDIKKELNHIESTIVWKWFFTENKEKKDQILEKLFSIMYEQHNK